MHRTKRPRTSPFEQVSRKRILLSWPGRIVNGISEYVSLADTMFIRQAVNLADATGYDSSWHAERFLGSGAHGLVALWQQRDESGELLDEVSIKDDYDSRAQFRFIDQLQPPGVADNIKKGEPYSFSPSSRMRVPMEALTQSAANRDYSENVLHLRKFVTIMKHRLRYQDTSYQIKSEASRYRYYLEYAPYGNLYGLLLRHKALNRYLPEFFLWHAFDSLAKALCDLDPGTQLFPGSLSDNIIHFDMKPENILLGYESPYSASRSGGIHDSEFQKRAARLNYGMQQDVDSQSDPPHMFKLPLYPMVKLADFGLAQLAAHKHPVQASWAQGTGTHGYQPPEQFRLAGLVAEPGFGLLRPCYGGDWEHKVYAPTELVTVLDKEEPAQTAKMNVWCLGKVMLDVASLSKGKDFMQRQAPDLQGFLQNKESMITDFAKQPFDKDILRARSPYSSELISLIHRCMEVDSRLRPSAEDLRKLTQFELLKCFREEAKRSSPAFTEGLFYRNEDINIHSDQYQSGKLACQLPLDVKEYYRMRYSNGEDHDDPPLDINAHRVHMYRPKDTPAEFMKRDQELKGRHKDILQQDKLRRAGLEDSDFVSRADGRLWFKDDLTSEQESDSSDDEPDDDRHHEGLDNRYAVRIKGRRLDVSSTPKLPESAYHMFVEFTKRQSSREMSEEGLTKAWNALSPKRKAIFERKYKQAQRYHKAHMRHHNLRPRRRYPRPPHLAYDDQSWDQMDITAQGLWWQQHDEDYKRVIDGVHAEELRRWKRELRMKPPKDSSQSEAGEPEAQQAQAQAQAQVRAQVQAIQAQAQAQRLLDLAARDLRPKSQSPESARALWKAVTRENKAEQTLADQDEADTDSDTLNEIWKEVPSVLKAQFQEEAQRRLAARRVSQDGRPPIQPAATRKQIAKRHTWNDLSHRVSTSVPSDFHNVSTTASSDSHLVPTLTIPYPHNGPVRMMFDGLRLSSLPRGPYSAPAVLAQARPVQVQPVQTQPVQTQPTNQRIRKTEAEKLKDGLNGEEFEPKGAKAERRAAAQARIERDRAETAGTVPTGATTRNTGVKEAPKKKTSTKVENTVARKGKGKK